MVYVYSSVFKKYNLGNNLHIKYGGIATMWHLIHNPWGAEDAAGSIINYAMRNEVFVKMNGFFRDKWDADFLPFSAIR